LRLRDGVGTKCDASILTLPLAGRVGARSAPGWGSSELDIHHHPKPLPKRRRGADHGIAGPALL
jgi:hypothetical protein